MYPHPFLALRLVEERQAEIEQQVRSLRTVKPRKRGRLSSLLWRPGPTPEPQPALASGGP